MSDKPRWGQTYLDAIMNDLVDAKAELAALREVAEVAETLIVSPHMDQFIICEDALERALAQWQELDND